MTAVMATMPTDDNESAPGRGAVAGWVSYDIGNTLFSANILSNYFALWIVRDAGGSEAAVAVAGFAASLVMLGAAPLLGALSDRAARRLPFLAVSTLACCLLTALLGVGGASVALPLFVAASVCFQAGLVFYDALLPAVSTPQNRGRVGGLGVGLGYLGTVVGLALGTVVLARGGGAPTIFLLTAIGFAVFALPCFLFVREPAIGGRRLDGAAVHAAFADLAQTAALLRSLPRLGRFLLGRICYANAANTLTAYMSIYAVVQIGFSDQEKDILILAGFIGALSGGLAWGRVVDRIGPEAALRTVLALWTAVMAGTAVVGFDLLPKSVFWAVAPLAGLALGCTWTTDRPLLVKLSPPERLGQTSGLYAVTGRFGALIGQAIWWAAVGPLGWGSPAAVLALLGLVLASALILRPLWREA
jgi:UMF1 family MFS transporter